MIKAENGTVEIDGGGSELGMEFLSLTIALMQGGVTADVIEETVKLAIEINEAQKKLGIKTLGDADVTDDVLEKIANAIAMKRS